MRLFVAADIGPDIRAALRPAIERLQRLNAAVRWVREPYWHLTLKFLGAVPADSAADIGRAVQEEAARFAPFAMRLGRLHPFPPGRDPRIVAADVTEGVAELRALHEALDQRMQEFGVAGETRAFLAHLTLGRVTGPQGLERLWKAVAASGAGGPAGADFGAVQLAALVLFRSILKPEGAEYIQLATAKLTPPAPGGE
jgi:2'-5' RNA ligase